MIARVQEQEERMHEEKFADPKSTSETYWGMVHTPIRIDQALRIPNAKAAVDHEWNKLEVIKKAWDSSKVFERAAVIALAKTYCETIYFGEFMDLCHLKHSEQSEEFRALLKFLGHKGRVVFRGDKVRDESGFYAVFTEQGTSASHMAGGKFLDALARMPGMEGQISDAVSAYTQVELPDELETYITLPPRRRPKEWEAFDDPVCRLRLNLYGHPLAGLLWEKYCEKALQQLNFTKMKGWECMYVHKEHALFLSVYVDDFKMAGKSPWVKKMWPKISKVLDLEKAEDLNESVYLGCGQDDVEPQPERYAAKRDFWKDLAGVSKKKSNDTQKVKPKAKTSAKAKPKPKAKTKKAAKKIKSVGSESSSEESKPSKDDTTAKLTASKDSLSKIESVENLEEPKSDAGETLQQKKSEEDLQETDSNTMKDHFDPESKDKHGMLTKLLSEHRTEEDQCQHDTEAIPPMWQWMEPPTICHCEMCGKDWIEGPEQAEKTPSTSRWYGWDITNIQMQKMSTKRAQN